MNIDTVHRLETKLYTSNALHVNGFLVVNYMITCRFRTVPSQTVMRGCDLAIDVRTKTTKTLTISTSHKKKTPIPIDWWTYIGQHRPAPSDVNITIFPATKGKIGKCCNSIDILNVLFSVIGTHRIAIEWLSSHWKFVYLFWAMATTKHRPVH